MEKIDKKEATVAVKCGNCYKFKTPECPMAAPEVNDFCSKWRLKPEIGGKNDDNS